MSFVKNLVPVALIGLFFSCSDSADLNNDSQRVMAGIIIQAEKGEKFTFSNADNSSVDIRILSISESRCPEDGVCIWEGDVEVGFQIADLKSIVYLCLLQNTPDCKNEREVSYDGKTYTLTLLDVTPYPSTTNSDEKQMVEFTVRLKE